MAYSISSSALILISLLLIPISSAISATQDDGFLECISYHSHTPLNKASQLIYTQQNSSYSSVLQSTIYNQRYSGPTNRKPLLIVRPTNESHIQASILCCRKYGLDLRVRSGGHDFEGLSFTSTYDVPFVVVDLFNLNSTSINLKDNTMWVQSGATLGQVYYEIAQASSVLAFPAGIGAIVGVGGHLGGGGFSTMIRKHGLAADHILDAYLIDVDGRIRDRTSMGEDVFWAIRGGGAMSFGVVLKWKIKLVSVPPTVTCFTLIRTMDQNAGKLVDKWQRTAHKFDENLFIRIIAQPMAGLVPDKKILGFRFNSMFLGPVKELMPLMEKSFPELGLEEKDCLEMPWIDSVLYFSGLSRGPGGSLDALLDRNLRVKVYYKAKTEFVKRPIKKSVMDVVWERLSEQEYAFVTLTPLGGRMREIAGDEIPFPFRKGYSYHLLYMVRWGDGVNGTPIIDWVRKLYDFVGENVGNSRRGAYLNYRDLDLGVNGENNATYSTAKIWGERYFAGNFKRLARAKRAVDPTNFFRYEQSTPPL
ncbi:hypothetical protein ACLOJK_021388 [Asimina triloba]